MCKERIDFTRAHFTRMAFAVKEDETLDPTRVRFLCAAAIMLRTNDVAHLIEQLGRLLGGSRVSQSPQHRTLTRRVRSFIQMEKDQRIGFGVG